MKPLKSLAAAALLLAATLIALPAHAEKKYGPGASDTEIKIGQTMPYSGPASAYGAIGKAQAAYFQMDQRPGRRQRPQDQPHLAWTTATTRRRRSSRRASWSSRTQVLLLFQTLGTPTNTAIHKYVNAKKVPHLFLATGATKWSDPKNFPWTMGFSPIYQAEARIYAQYVLKNIPEREDRSAVPERRLRQGLPQRASRTALGRQGGSMIVDRGLATR